MTMDDEAFVVLLRSLHVNTGHPKYEWRCGECRQPQPIGSVVAWIPDGMSRSQSLGDLVVRCRREAWNGHTTAWCLPCCRTFRPVSPRELEQATQTRHDPIPKFSDRGI
jgi:hypothetical protein